MNSGDLKAIAWASRVRRPAHVISGISCFTRTLTKRRFLWFTWWEIGKPVRA